MINSHHRNNKLSLLLFLSKFMPFLMACLHEANLLLKAPLEEEMQSLKELQMIAEQLPSIDMKHSTENDSIRIE